MAQQAAHYPRTLYEARLDARFYEVFHARNVRFFRRLRGLFGFVSLLSGTAAVTLLIQQNAVVGAMAGVSIATVTILDQLIDPARHALANELAEKDYAGVVLRAKARDATLEDVDADLARAGIAATAASLLSLRSTVYNEVQREVGRDECVMPVSLRERFVALLA